MVAQDDRLENRNPRELDVVRVRQPEMAHFLEPGSGLLAPIHAHLSSGLAYRDMLT
jgi:hypothetical protein